MPFKTIELPQVGAVRLYKRKGSRHIRLSVGSNGSVRVTLPAWAPYRLGAEFALSKRDWIIARKPVLPVLTEGKQIGKTHRLTFIQEQHRGKISTRLQGSMIRVFMPHDSAINSAEVQRAATKAAVRALQSEAERLLPIRLRQLALQHGFSYREVRIKQLKGRWGSCSQQGDITLNCFLMQLPWEVVDYVLLHELMHTRIMAHGPAFWNELARYIPDLSQVRKQARQYQPILQSL